MSVVKYRTQHPFRLFDELFNETYSKIPVDLLEDNENYIVKANLPGISKENVDIEINQVDRYLVLRAENKTEVNQANEENGIKYIHRERGISKVARTIHFRQPIDTSKATTLFENGVLTITLPKSEEAKPFRLTIN